MPKSRWFLSVSLLFLLADFCWLIFWDHNQNIDFDFSRLYDFEASIVKLDKKTDGWQMVVAPRRLPGFSGRLITYLPLYPEYDIGDILQINCRLKLPEPLVDARGREFFYDKYLAKDKISAVCQWPKIKVIGQERGVRYYFYRVKKYLWQNLNDYLVEPSSSLGKAMLLATSREVPATVNQAFARVGLSHVIAISGMHMVVIAWLLNTILIALGWSRQNALWLVLLIILFYLFLTGLPGSAVRSVIMLFVVFIGQALGRRSTPFFSLLWSADIIVLLNPYVLLYDVGWQLSFLAVLGLLCYGKFFNKLLFFMPEIFGIREVCAVTLAAQIFTTPLIVYYFGIFSLVAPVANLIIVPLSTLTLILSMLLGIFGFWPLLAWLLAWPLFILLKIMVMTAEYLAGWPGAFLTLGVFPVSYLWLALTLLFIITWLLKPYHYE
ncbi:MAG: hypothetical protein C3F02_03765 [Parcubacteria group bacterium]|nr:MAG: hypothetical protein C3F02_03765 [Parcubacteria group bacterium]